MKLLLSAAKKYLAYLFKGVLLIFTLLVVWAAIVASHDPRPKDIIDRDKALQHALADIASAPIDKKATKLSLIQPQSWSYVCIVDQMTTGSSSLRFPDQATANHAVSNDIKTIDDDNGLVFFDSMSRSYIAFHVPYLFRLPSSLETFKPICIERDMAHLSAEKTKDGFILLNLTAEGEK